MNWIWKNFTKKEIDCNGETCGCNHELWDISEYGTEYPFYFVESMNALQALRNKWKKPIVINSAHRCVNHNKAVGGASKSHHLLLAFDCVITATAQNVFVDMAKECGFNGIGYYPTKGFVHIDIREKAATWYG